MVSSPKISPIRTFHEKDSLENIDNSSNKSHKKSTFVKKSTMNTASAKIQDEETSEDLMAKLESFRSEINAKSMSTTVFFLYASPLLHRFSSKGHTKPVAQLNFKKEFEEIESSLHESKFQIRYSKKVATIDNLPDIIIDNPFVLHFSGHGLKNDYENIGTDAFVKEGEGDMLLLEDNC